MKRWLFLGIILVAVVALVGWRLVQKKTAADELAKTAASRSTGEVSVSAAVAGPRDMDEGLEAVGNIFSPFNAKLSPKVQGLIRDLQVREGDTVTAGQVLVRLDPDTLNATVLENKANVAQAHQRYEQARATQNSTNVGVDTSIRQQQAAVDTMRANLHVVEQNHDARVAAAQAAVSDGNAKIRQDLATKASAEATLQSADATLADAKTKLNRDLELYKQNYIAAQDVDDQKAAVAVAAAQVNVAQKGIDAAAQLVESATQERNASQNQLDITKKQADADLEVAKQAVVNALQALRLAVANTSQSPAYQANLDALKASEDAARGTLQASEVLLNDINIATPIDGTVTARTLDPGSIAQPGTAILTVQFLKWVYFNATIPVEQSSTVHKGQTAHVTLDSFPGRTFTGQIVQVGLVADQTSHQFLVQVKLDNPDLLLRPGMFGHISVVVNKKHADVVVPREAVTKNADGTYSAYRIDPDNTVHLTTVTIGAEDSHGYEILSGLKSGDKVVTLTYQALKDGRKVTVTALSTPESGGFGVDTLLPSASQGGAGKAKGSAPTGQTQATPGAKMADSKGN